VIPSASEDAPNGLAPLERKTDRGCPRLLYFFLIHPRRKGVGVLRKMDAPNGLAPLERTMDAPNGLAPLERTMDAPNGLAPLERKME